MSTADGPEHVAGAPAGSAGRGQVVIRPLTEGDAGAAWQLSRVAFGGPAEPPAERRPVPRPGLHAYGAFDPSGRLLAKAVDLEHGYWYGGRSVPGTGVAGVAVAAESRGAGLAGRLLGHLLARARERGAAVSALFPTTTVPYRRLGWEVAGTLTWTALPTASLAELRPPPGTRLRPATPADVPALLAAYDATAREGTGMLGRAGPLFVREPERVIAEFDGITVADGPDGEPAGYVSWERGAGYDESSTLSVYDLVGRTPEATRALLANLGTWRSVTPTLHLRLAEPDPAWLLAGMAGAAVLTRQPWMFRVVDAEAAVLARGWPAHLSGSLDLALADELCPWNAGPWRLELRGGEGRLVTGGAGEVELTPNGLALLYTGAAPPPMLRRAGLLTGGNRATDEFLAAAGGGPPPALLDYF